MKRYRHVISYSFWLLLLTLSPTTIAASSQELPSGELLAESTRLAQGGSFGNASQLLEDALSEPERFEVLERIAIHVELARQLRLQGETTRAEELLETALQQADQTGHVSDGLEPRLGLARLHRDQKQFERANAELKAARRSMNDATLPVLKGRMLIVEAMLALDKNNPEATAELVQEALPLFRSSGATRDEVEALSLSATVRGIYQARFDEAFGLLDRCLDIAEQTGDLIGGLGCKKIRASLAYTLSDYASAINDFSEVAADDNPLPKKSKSTAKLNLALCFIHLGEYGAGRLFIEQALSAARTPGRTEYPVAVPLYYRGYLLSRLGDTEGAMKDYRAALKLFREAQNSYFESYLLVDIAEILLQDGRTAEARLEYEQSLKIHTEAGNPRGLMLGEEGIGRTLLVQGDPSAAEVRLRKGLELATEVGDDHGWARIAIVLADDLLRPSRPEEAAQLLRQAGEKAARSSLLEEQFRAALGLARTLRDQGRRDEALAGYLSTLDLLEEIRGKLQSESQHLTFADGRSVAYRETVALLLDGDPDKLAITAAFEVSERARARALLELMQHTRLAAATRTAGRHRQRLKIVSRISRAQTRLLAGSGDGEAVSRSLDMAREELERFDIEEAASLPAQVHPRPLSLPEVVKLPTLAQQTLAVYWITPERSCLWVIRNGAVLLLELGAYEELTEAITAYRQALSREPGWKNPPASWIDHARHLSDLLQVHEMLAPANADDSRTILIVPDGPLLGLPLEPLVIGMENSDAPTVLGDKVDLVYLPSASFLAFDSMLPEADRQPGLKLVAFGDPAGGGSTVDADRHVSTSPPLVNRVELPGARDEVRKISALFPEDQATVYLGADATETALRTPEVSEADILHIAAQAWVPDEHPELAGIALSIGAQDEDGFLRLHELASLGLDAKLAVLSACSTGKGKPVAGEGLHGLARAFLIAGVPAVVTSQWDVSDRATALLMERFYRHLLSGDPAHIALAKASSELRRDEIPVYSHPHYWAPFILFGMPPDSFSY